ncbi:MAG: hypothetical protein FJ254_07540 [Phycisphaerae bacterium]|nr:hypothetical protein [Phycisphaerae bacterium]
MSASTAPAPAKRTTTPLPRWLVLAAFCWLGASWAISTGFVSPSSATRAGVAHAVQTFTLMVAAGAVVAWPLARLSLTRPGAIVRTVVLDAMTIVVLVHVTIFPLRAISGWSRDRLLLLDASLMSAIAIAASVLLVGLRTDRMVRRVLASIAIVLLAVGPEAPWISLGFQAPNVARALPGALSVAWSLSDPSPGPVNEAMTSDTLATAIIAAAALCTALAWSRRPVTLA